jgi:hypothetical protein
VGVFCSAEECWVAGTGAEGGCGLVGAEFSAGAGFSWGFGGGGGGWGGAAVGVGSVTTLPPL